MRKIWQKREIKNRLKIQKVFLWRKCENKTKDFFLSAAYATTTKNEEPSVFHCLKKRLQISCVDFVHNLYVIYV